MPDQSDPPQVRRTDSSDKMTATSLTAGGMASTLLWIFGMIDAHKFFVPDTGTAMFMGAALLPIGTAIGKRWIKELERGTNIGGPGVNAGPINNRLSETETLTPA